MIISRSILALTRAGSVVFAGEVYVIEFLKRSGQSTLNNRVNIPDPFTSEAALEALVACRGWPAPLDVPEAQENNIKFWTWYMDEAIPWAVEQTNKRLGTETE